MAFTLRICVTLKFIDLELLPLIGQEQTKTVYYSIDSAVTVAGERERLFMTFLLYFIYYFYF